ncbi:MAG TPA: hypothetical protein VGE55_00650 [Limnobacter sp.]|uniref:hypothetical protein n=1 Tax=Limnobacter sp. TaxID=2003368 RepID=UPI002EDA614A
MALPPKAAFQELANNFAFYFDRANRTALLNLAKQREKEMDLKTKARERLASAIKAWLRLLTPMGS